MISYLVADHTAHGHNSRSSSRGIGSSSDRDRSNSSSSSSSGSSGVSDGGSGSVMDDMDDALMRHRALTEELTHLQRAVDALQRGLGPE